MNFTFTGIYKLAIGPMQEYGPGNDKITDLEAGPNRVE